MEKERESTEKGGVGEKRQRALVFQNSIADIRTRKKEGG